jgi:peptide/nickel transport system permease protein
VRWHDFLIRRCAWAAGTVLFVLALNFVLFRVLPGDPARAGVRDPRLGVAAQEALRARFGLDRPVINCVASLNPLRFEDCLVNPLETQFLLYLQNLARGDLGISYQFNRPVGTILAERLWNTLLLVGLGQLLAIVVGSAMGALAAWRAGSPADYVILSLSLVAWSLPSFWLGIILLFWGSHFLGLPLAGQITPGAQWASAWAEWRDLGRHMLLPTLTFTIIFLGEYALIMRSTMAGVLSEDYILAARAKGLGTFQVLRRHALGNAMLPLVTIIALNLGFTVAGAIQIETVFSWPGLGKLVFDAISRRDYPVLQGAFLLLTVSVVLANLLADLLYGWLDPRVRVR